MVSYPGTNALYVTYDAQRADNGTNYLGLFVGHREAVGQLSQTGLTNIYNVKFDTDWLCSFSGLAIFVQRTTRNGRLVTTNVSGSWGSTGYFGPAGPRGTFQADPVQ